MLEEWGLYLVQQLGVGGILGVVAGYALKKIAKLAAILLGCLFIILQLLAFHHMIEINWGNIAEAIQPHVTGEGARQAAGGFWRVLVYNIPFAAAFATGFFLGFRKG